ncbi:MAG: hypothetical protein POELPBGB_01326 [Bacteroidia bacterium]|nr:hypothetical protein [Bacteroidia bacterium]
MPTPPPLATSKDTNSVVLFRFANLEDPTKKAVTASSSDSFLEHPNPGNSVFIDAVAGTTTQAERDAAVAAVLTTYEPISSPKDVIDINPGLYAFSEFVKTFNRKTNPATLVAKAEDIDELTSEQLDDLWDNLFYQAYTTKSSIIAESILLLLRGNTFLVEYNAQNEIPGEPTPEIVEANLNKLLRIAGAIANVPANLVALDKVSVPGRKEGLDAESKENLSRLNNADKAHYHISRINAVLSEVECAEKKYKDEYTTAYNAALARHNAGRTVVSRGKQSGAIPSDFKFKFREPLDPTFVSDNLSEEGQEYLSTLKCGVKKTWADVSTALQKRRSEKYQVLFRNAPKQNGKVFFKDITIPVVQRTTNNSYVISTEEVPGTDGLRSLFITHYYESAETATVGMSVQLSGGGLAAPVTASSSMPVQRSANHSTFLLFERGLPISDSDYALSGSYEIENNSFSREFDVPAFRFTRPVYGTLHFGQIYINTDNDTQPGTEDIQLYGVKHIGVLEYKRVEQELCCYVAGEVSHIENIMAREYKEKATRNLTRSEITQEDTKEKESEDLKDTTSTDRHEMQKEISQVMQEEQSRQIGVTAGVNANYSMGDTFQLGVNAGTNMNFTNGSNQTNSFSQSESFAQEVTQRALQRIVEKTTSKRTSRMLREYEDTYKHGFDNRAGDKHVTGIYRWVDKIYLNKLVNYGKRLQYDFMVPEPSKNFKHWMTLDTKKGDGDTGVKEPLPLTAFGIKSNFGTEGKNEGWKNINRDNYANAAAAYGADVDTCPPETLTIGKSFSENPLGKFPTKWDEPRDSFQFEFEIPDGYYCEGFTGAFTHVLGHRGTITFADARIAIDKSHFYYTRHTNILADGNSGNTNPEISATNIYVTKLLPIGISTFNMGGFSLNVMASCKLTTDAFNSWAQATYIAILTAYNKRMEEFLNAKAAKAPQGPEQIDYKFNPLEGRAIEQRELKRSCMELMMAPFGLYTGRNNYIKDDCHDNYNIDRSFAFQKHANCVKFMEEAFSWDLMSYHFYPYYWTSEFDWATIIKESSSADSLFQAFLQSGMARVSVPVRIGFEYPVMYFLNTGKIWKSDKVAAGGANDPLYRSIAQLLDLTIGKVEAEWKTRVPSALTIIQSDSAPLDANGLPCGLATHSLPGEDYPAGYMCEDGTPIAQGNNILAGIPDAGTGSGGNPSTNMVGKFLFPKHADLSANDVGKLVMNDGDGLAKVYQLADALPEQTGKFIISIEDLGDLTDNSEIEINTATFSIIFDRPDWRGVETPTTVIEELELIRDYILTITELANLTPTVVDDTLVLEETAMESTRIELDGFPLFGSLVIERVSRPESPIAAVGFPLGKLLAIQGDNAIISSETVQTFTLESAYTVNNDMFNSSYEFNLDSEADFAAVLNNLIIPAADGKVKPLGLTPDIIGRDFLTTYRNQFVGIAISTSGMEVNVMKISNLTYLWQLMRKTLAENALGI